MKLIDQSIRNYHTVTVMVVLAAAVGVFCFQILPRQLTPTVDKPIIEVKTEYRGLSPNEVERNITRRLEEQLESVEGLKKMTSRSQHGLSTITLEFEWGTDKNIATIDVDWEGVESDDAVTLLSAAVAIDVNDVSVFARIRF